MPFIISVYIKYCLCIYKTLKAFLGGMIDRDRGHVVAMSSITSLLAAPNLVDYCTSKSGVTMMMEALRQEVVYLKKHGVGFTTILPTKVDTGLFEGAKGRYLHAKLYLPTTLCSNKKLTICFIVRGFKKLR